MEQTQVPILKQVLDTLFKILGPKQRLSTEACATLYYMFPKTQLEKTPSSVLCVKSAFPTLQRQIWDRT